MSARIRKEEVEPTCPKCGGDSGYSVADYVTGWEHRTGRWNGDEEVTNSDGLRYRVSKNVTCDDCGKRIPRPSGDTHVRDIPPSPEGR